MTNSTISQFKFEAEQENNEGLISECPACGAPCDHSDGQKQMFALDALQEAAIWYESLMK